LPEPDLKTGAVDDVTEATVYAAGRIAAQLDAKMVICASTEGETARTLSKNRNFVPTVGVSDSEATLRRMCLYWGVIPLRNVPTGDAKMLLDYVIARARDISYVEPGDRVVLITGTRLIDRGLNAILVHEVD
jgi:pyruvate kinase